VTVSNIPPEFQGDDALFGTAVELANSILAVTETCTRYFGIEAGGAPIKSQPGPEPLYEQFKSRGYTFHLLYSDNPDLSGFFSSDMFLILQEKHVKVIWGYVRAQRRNLLNTLAQSTGNPAPTRPGQMTHTPAWSSVV